MTTETPESGHGRRWAADRRQSLVEAAARLLAARGVDAVRMPVVAETAGVTRPVVYKHFANRQAVIIAVLEDFDESLERRFEVVRGDGPISLVQALRRIITATCDAIEEKGPGAWRLLGSSGPDREVEGVARAIRDRMLGRWRTRITRATRADEAEILALSQMTSTVTRGVLDLWLDGRLRREQAIEIAMRAVRAVMDEFTHDPAPPKGDLRPCES